LVFLAIFIDGFYSYLTGRSQRVVLDGCSSASLPVHSGVPQGSILGPLLFSIYINPLASLSLSSSTRLLLYADDILLYKPIHSAWDLLSLQCDIDMVSDWISSAGLRLNVTKTKLMAISQKKARSSFNLFANGSLISQVSSHVYLGVTLTDDLTFNRHINNTCLKARSQLGLLYRQFSLASPSALSHLYKTLVLPTLDYCSSLWDPLYEVHSNRLEGVQRLAAKIVTEVGRPLRPSVEHTEMGKTVASKKEAKSNVMSPHPKRGLNYPIQFLLTSPFPPHQAQSFISSLLPKCQDSCSPIIFLK